MPHKLNSPFPGISGFDVNRAGVSYLQCDAGSSSQVQVKFVEPPVFHRNIMSNPRSAPLLINGI